MFASLKNQQKGGERKNSESSLNKRILRVVSVAVFILLTYFLVSDYFTTIGHAEQLTLVRLQGIVDALSQQIDGDQHQSVSDKYLYKEAITSSQEDKDYQALHNLLAQAYHAHQLNTPIYTFVKSKDKLGVLEFIASSSPNPYYRHSYTTFPKHAYAQLDRGGTLSHYISDGQYWISAYAPIRNSQNEIVAYLQVDEKFDHFIAMVRKKTMQNAAYCILGFGLIILILLPYLKQLITEEERQRARLEKSLEETRHLSEELAKREEQLKENTAKLEQSNKDLMDFAHIASHDLKSPIRNIKSFAHLLKKRHAANIDSSGMEFLQFIIDGADRAEKLITGLLTYSRADKNMNEQQTFYMCDSIDVALQNLLSVTQERNAEVVYNKMPVIKANPSLIAQVLQNLINNGIKYNESPEPLIEIGAKRKDGKEEVCFYVRDNGIGIPEEYQSDIFKMFTRLHSSHKYEGSGIGLAFCNRVVNGYGGKMWLESEPGKGSTFFFTLPKAMPHFEAAVMA